MYAGNSADTPFRKSNDMKAGFAQTDISPLMPVKQAGFIQQTEKRSEIRDRLYVQMIGMEDEEKVLILLSADALGMPADVQQEIQDRLSDHWNKPVQVILCCTHTHFAPDIKDPKYRTQFVSQASEMILHCSWKEVSEPGISFRKAFFDGLGKSRISAYPSDQIFLSVIGLHDGNKELCDLIVYNCHPTVMNGYTPFFSAEYPGYVKRRLKELHPDRNFVFLQSCAGDISTRFTRKSQDYEAMCELGEKLVCRAEEMLSEPADLLPAGKILTEQRTVSITHVFEPIDISKLPEGITEREIETIRIGAQVREKLAQKLDTLPKEVTLTALHAGRLCLIFCPNELFSGYLKNLGSDTSMLVCYSTGYGGYVTPPHFTALTYERFTDTWSDETKEEIASLIRNLSENR